MFIEAVILPCSRAFYDTSTYLKSGAVNINLYVAKPWSLVNHFKMMLEFAGKVGVFHQMRFSLVEEAVLWLNHDENIDQ